MIKNISGIKYENNPYGEAFGGGIYTASCQIGYSNNPTKISLSVISENSEYTISDADLNVTDTGPKKITIGGTIPPGGGNPTNSVEFNRMYIYSYSKSDTPGAKTLTVNFIDHSIMLDKIFVGLIGRHGTRTTIDYGEGNKYNPANDVQVTPVQMTWGFRLICEECNELRPSKILRPPSWKAPYDITRSMYQAGTGTACPQPLRTYINVTPGLASVNGGYILLGQEEFKDTECEIPKVSYTFEDLCNALDWMLGGDPMGCNGPPEYRHNLRDFERSKTYTGTYTGTLREVLSAWAADFSFDFTFDYESADPKITAIDLKLPVDLADVKNAISIGFGPDSEGGLIRSHREVHTLENTYYQTPLVKYIKPPRQFQRTKQNYDPRLGKVLTVRDAIGTSGHLGRSDDELDVSMALAKYSQESRLIWLSDLARVKHEDENWCNPNHGKDMPDILGKGGQQTGCAHLAPYNLPDATIDPKYDSTIHGKCSDSKFTTKHDCESNDRANFPTAWIPNVNDTKLRTDSPWPALGFYPSLSFNKLHLIAGRGHGDATGIPGGGTGAGVFDYRNNLIKHGGGPGSCTDGGGAAATNYKTKDECLCGYGGIWNHTTNLGCLDGANNSTSPRVWTAPTLTDEQGGGAALHQRFNPAFLDGTECYANPTKCLKVKQKYVNQDGPHAGALKDYKNAEVSGDDAKRCDQIIGMGNFAAPEGTCHQYHIDNAGVANDMRMKLQLAGADGFDIDENGNHPIFSDPTKYSLYLGIWNEAYQDKVGDFDKELADNFLGKYGYWYGNRTSDELVEAGIFNMGPVNPPPNVRSCPKWHWDLEGGQQHATYLYQYKINTLPESKIYSGASYPFANILKANGGFFAKPEGVADTQPYCTYCPERSVFEIEDNTWGTAPDQVTKMLRNRHIVESTGSVPFRDDPTTMSDLNLYIPKYKRISPSSDGQRGWFINIVGFDSFQEHIVQPEHMKSGYFPGIALIPHMDEMYVDIREDQCVDKNTGNEIMDGASPPAPKYLTKKACDGAGPPALWYEGAVERYDPVLKVDYSHWRCTQAQTAGTAPCPPDDLYVGAPPCDEHWCHTGAGWCEGLDSDIDLVADLPQPSTNDIAPSMSGEEACHDAPAGYQGNWHDNLPFGHTPSDPNWTPAHSSTGSTKLGAGGAQDGSLPMTVTKTTANGQPEYMFKTVPGSRYCTTNPNDGAYSSDCWGTYREDAEVFAALVFDNFDRRERESLIGKPSECTLYCEEDIKTQVCASECPEKDEPLHGFQSYTAKYLEITHMTDRVKIVYPIMHIYTGFWYSDQLDKGTMMRKQMVMGEPPTPQELKERNVMGTRIIDFDATPDLDALESSVQGQFQEQITIMNSTLHPPQPEVVTLDQYYSFLLGTTQSAQDPSEQIDVRVDGTEFDQLVSLLTPHNGLTTFNITLDGEGVSTNLSFRTRPKKLPKRDVLLQKIGPQALQGRIPKAPKNIQDFRVTQANQAKGP